ncbi:unnamed protein product [Cylicostephanus goldi]|uniref:SAM-dependent MTase TRM10-type domain-containing protein n=1 Tax=Cylicostephanus goldi TaxID=71465 RepID=A0A3P6QPK3_CYLGO|nr:unnamed protein product [Cylicostephanus goldi]
MRNQTIAPIQWDEPLLKVLPDRTLGGRLDSGQIQKFDSIVREVKTISMLTKYFPSRITDEDWQILLECETRKQRFDHIKFLRSRELEKIKDLEKKRAKEKLEKLQKPRALSDNPPPLYYPATKLVKDQRRHQWYKVALAYLCNAPRIVIDCRFLPLLSPRGAELTAVQLNYLISENRDSKTPWQVYFANFDLSSKRVQRLQQK